MVNLCINITELNKAQLAKVVRHFAKYKFQFTMEQLHHGPWPFLMLNEYKREAVLCDQSTICPLTIELTIDDLM